MFYKSYSKDPKWIKAKFNSKCSECSFIINKGERAYYYPLGKHIFCTKCAAKHEADFQSAAFDEYVYNNQ